MIWQIYALVFGFGALMFAMAVRHVAIVPATAAFLTYGYLAIIGGSVEVVESGITTGFQYTSLARFTMLLAIGALFVAIWAFAAGALEESGRSEFTADDTATELP